MKPPSSETLSLMAVAVELRASGASWETIATHVPRSPRTCRSWRLVYPHEWRRLYRAAEERLVTDVGAESIMVLRKLLRAKDDKICRDAARLLLNTRMQLRILEDRVAGAASDTDDACQIAFLRDQDDAQIEAFVDEQLARRQSLSGAGALAASSPAGPALPG